MSFRTPLSVVIALTASLAFAGEMPWAKDFASAKKLAKSSGKLIMLDFYADWCSWCEKLDTVTFVDDGVVRLAGQFVPLKVNFEKGGGDLVRKYEVSALPTVLFVDIEGEVWGKIVGYHKPNAFMDSMNGIIDVRKKYAVAMRTLRRNPKDGKANAQVARIHATFGRLMQATSAVKKMEAAKYKGKDLAAVYNAVGTGYQSAGELDDAIKYFVKAEAAGKAAKSPEDRSSALISMVDCYAAIGDMDTAKKYALQLINLTGAAKKHVDRARRFLGSG